MYWDKKKLFYFFCDINQRAVNRASCRTQNMQNISEVQLQTLTLLSCFDLDSSDGGEFTFAVDGAAGVAKCLLCLGHVVLGFVHTRIKYKLFITTYKKNVQVSQEIVCVGPPLP